MSGMTDWFRHPRMSLAGIHPKKAQMEARLTMSGMTAGQEWMSDNNKGHDNDGENK